MGLILNFIKKVKAIIFMVIIIIVILIIVKVCKLKDSVKDMVAKEVGIADKIMKKGVMGSFIDFMADNMTKKSESKADGENKSSGEEIDEPEKEDYDIGSFLAPEPNIKNREKKPPKLSRKKVTASNLESIIKEADKNIAHKGRDKIRRSNSKVSKYKREEMCRKILEDYFDDYFPTVRPKFLRNPKTGYPLELDGYNSRLSLAFEGQGAQHYVYPNAFHKTREDFDKQVERDNHKKKRLAELEIDLIEINFMAVPLENTETYIHGELKRLGYKPVKT